MRAEPPTNPVVTATITPTGVLTVWGLGPGSQVVDEMAPPAARNELINLLHAAAVDRGIPVCAAARTPAGPWYLAVHPDGTTVPLDPASFAGVQLPELDPEFALAGAEAVFAAAQDSPPAATLALACDPDPAIRAAATERLATWADDQTPVADAQLPASRLEVLAGCSLAWVRAGVAANPLTEPTTLAGLVDDPDPLVRRALAARFDLAPEVTVQLASDADPGVRADLERNPAAAFLTAAHPTAFLTAAHPTTVVAARRRPTPVAAPMAAPAASLPGDPAPAAGRGRPPRRVVAAGVTLGAAVLVATGYAAVNTLASGAPTPPAVTVSAPAGNALWNGMVLPAGPEGPTDPGGDVASGFAHTELGAAMAAAHLSVRIDPYAGPASFTPTITEQTYGGDPAALLAATQARYDTAAARAGVTDGGPIPTSTGQIVGWRIDGWGPDAPATVHLRVTGPDGVDTDYGIAVVWVHGDYALVDPTRADTFTTTPAADPSSYRSFR